MVAQIGDALHRSGQPRRRAAIRGQSAAPLRPAMETLPSQQSLALDPGVALAYAVDDYTDPWRAPETLVLVHGLAESGEAWRLKVKQSELFVIPGDGYHASAVNPATCARAALAFIGRHPI